MKRTAKFKPLSRMSREDLEAVARRMERRAVGEPEDLRKMTREQLVAYSESLRQPVAPRLSKKRAAGSRMPKNRGVGRYCRELLARVIETNADGPVGLSYNKMVKMAAQKFPDSRVDEKHLRWYAAQMRRDNKTIPVERRRSRWITG